MNSNITIESEGVVGFLTEKTPTPDLEIVSTHGSDVRQIMSRQGDIILVDAEDYEELNKRKWHRSFGRGAGGAKRLRGFHAGKMVNGKATHIAMHRLLMKLEDPKKQVDHINRDVYDNRKSNLRVCTPSENQRNTGVRKSNTSGFKGVSNRSDGKRLKKVWRAELRLTDPSSGLCSRFSLGTFKTPEEAARAYDEAVIKHTGSDIGTNKALGLLK